MRDEEKITGSYEETIEYGKTIGKSLKGHEVLVLKGPLASGKTVLTKGIALGLGIKETISSPSFTLMNIYEGSNLDLCHCDLYRIERLEGFWDLGIEEYINEKTVVVIEWGDMFMNELAIPFSIIELEVLEGSSRRIRLSKASF